jgi:Ni,Fe-hydrogenase III component G
MSNFPISFESISEFKAHIVGTHPMNKSNKEFELIENRHKDSVEIVMNILNTPLEIVVGHKESNISPNYGMIAAVELLLESIEKCKVKLSRVKLSVEAMKTKPTVDDLVEGTKKVITIQDERGVTVNGTHIFLTKVQKQIENHSA